MTTYTDVGRIAAQLGLSEPMSDEQAARADVVADAVTAWIDQRTSRSWRATAAVTDELHLIYGERVYVNACPLSTVESISYHAGYAGAGWTTIDADLYEIADAQRGVILLPSGYDCRYVRVSYTHTSTVPADIAAAADALAADLLQTTLNPESAGAESVSVGQNDISVKYAGSGGQQSAAVKLALAVIDGHRLPVLA